MALPWTEASVFLRPSREHGYLAEGPRLLPDGRLLWITIQSGKDGEQATRGAIHIADLDEGENSTWELDSRPGFAIPTDEPNVLLVGMERSVGWLDLDAGTYDELVEGLDDHCEGTICNDGEPFRDGVIFGMKDTAFAERKAGLYFLRQRDGELFRLRDDQLCSNGKVIRELDDRQVELFDIDTPTRVVRRYVLDVEAGTLSEPTIAIDLTAERGVPDGMCAIPDTDDVVIAMFDAADATYGRALRCSLGTGRIVEEFRTPGAAQVTCPAWVPGDDGCHIVLTTASENLTPARFAKQKSAGCLFSVDAVP